jgi:hypothetical protein
MTHPADPQTIRMARAMISVRRASADDCCREADLAALGFNLFDLRRRGPEAARLAQAMLDEADLMLAAESAEAAAPAIIPLEVLTTVKDARDYWSLGATFAATICAKWAGILAHEADVPPHANPFDPDAETVMASAYANGRLLGRQAALPTATVHSLPHRAAPTHAAASHAALAE